MKQVHVQFKLSLSPVWLLAILLAAPASFRGQVSVQSAAKPAPQDTAPSIGSYKPISADNLTDREYSNVWPKPSFPSSDREKKQFTVEYVYRYAQSDYKPAVAIPQITHAQSQTDTPEHTFIAFISALKSLDYDWWLSLWDTRSQQMFREEAVSKKQDAAYYKAQWQHQFGGLPVTLYSRVETVQDIMLEYRIGVQKPGQPTPLYPAPMRNESGRWLLTRELGDSSFVPFLGQPVISGPLDFMPAPAYSGQPVHPVVTQSQDLFFHNVGLGTSSATSFPW
jgi:hypothetical protein